MEDEESMSESSPQVLDFPVFYEEDETGGYVVVCPALQGCYSQGDTIEQAEANIRECILMCLEDMEEHGEPLPRMGGRYVGHVVLQR